MARTKYVTIESHGKIPALGGLLGPVLTPCYLDINIIITLINNGKIVYEVNPSNIKEKTRLTRRNVLDYIYTQSLNKDIKAGIVKASDVGLASATIEPSTVATTINSDTGECGVSTDIFSSNKYS